MFSFEEPQIPDCITATHSRLSVSDLHYKDGKHSLEWTFEPGGILELKKDRSLRRKIRPARIYIFRLLLCGFIMKFPKMRPLSFSF